MNFLGATDDGAGRYPTGFDFDDKHPNASGHREFFYAFVPSLFEALEKGKLTPQRIEPGKGFMRIVSSGFAPLSFGTRDTIHSFALSFEIRADSNGTIAGISGSTLSSSTEAKRAGARGQTQFQSTTLSADRVPSTAMIDIHEGHFSYVLPEENDHQFLGASGWPMASNRVEPLCSTWGNAVLCGRGTRGQGLRAFRAEWIYSWRIGS